VVPVSASARQSAWKEHHYLRLTLLADCNQHGGTCHFCIFIIFIKLISCVFVLVFVFVNDFIVQHLGISQPSLLRSQTS
jgi:hypothetical protein